MEPITDAGQPGREPTVPGGTEGRPPKASWVVRLWAGVLCGVFLAVLWAPLALMAQGIRPGAVENREATALPDAGALLTADREALGELQDWFRDRLPGLDLAIAADATFDLIIRRESPNREILPGREGWLFLSWTIDQACFDDRDVQAVQSTFRHLRSAARDGGRQLVLLVIPDKAAVRPDMLEAADRATSCARPNAEALERGLTDRNVLVPLDLLDARVARGEPTYHALDSHWTDEASHEVAEALVRHLGIDTSTASTVVASTAEVPEDLKQLQGLPETRIDACWRTERPGIVVVQQPADCDHDVTAPIVTRATTQGIEPLLPPTTFVSDSFGLRMLEVLPAWFSRLEVVHKPDLQEIDVTDQVARSQIVVLQVVQRRLPALLGDRAFVDALAEALAGPRSS